MKKIILLMFFYSSINYCQSGIYKTYHVNGNLESELSFVDEIYEGTSYWYYENGNLKEEKTFSGGKLHGWVKSYFDTGLLKEEFYVNEGVKDGLHKTYYDNGGLKSVLSYEDGVLVKKIELEYDRLYSAPPELYMTGNRQYEIQTKNGDLICDSDLCPIPIGGMKSIQDAIVYPEHAKLYGLEGSVLLIADVNAKGIVTQTTIIEGIGLGCNEEAQRAVKETRFIPGQTNGKAVSSHLTIRIDFTLNDKSILSAGLGNGMKKKVSQVRGENKSLESEKSAANNTNSYAEKNTFSTSNMSEQEGGCAFDNCPVPKGGMDAVYKRILIPATAKRMKITGKVIVDVDVDEHGFVRNTKIIKGLGYGIDDAVEVAMFESEFIPGSDKGKIVRTFTRLELEIK